MSRTKATFYLTPEVLRATRVAASRTGRAPSRVVEEALRAYLGLGVFDAVWARNNLREDDALKLAYEEVHAARD